MHQSQIHRETLQPCRTVSLVPACLPRVRLQCSPCPPVVPTFFPADTLTSIVLCPGWPCAHTHWRTPACSGAWQKQVPLEDLHLNLKTIQTPVTSRPVSLPTACSSTTVTLGAACATPLTPVSAAGKSWASWEGRHLGTLHPPNLCLAQGHLLTPVPTSEPGSLLALYCWHPVLCHICAQVT